MEDNRKQSGDQIYWRALAYSCAVYFAVMLFFNFLRFWGYGFATEDFGTFHQLIWNAAHGNFFQSSTKFPFEATDSRLGFHFSILVTIVGTIVYKVLPHPEALLALHVSSVTLTAFPLFFTVRKLSASGGAGLFWALIYLCNPITIFHALFSLQDVSLAVFFMALALYAIVHQRTGVLVGSVLCLVLAKEQYGLTVAGLGVVWGWWNKSRKFAVGVVGGGLAAFYCVVFQIIPAFSPYREHFLISPHIDNVTYHRYQWLHGSGSQILLQMFQFLSSRETAVALAALLVPLLFTPLLGGVFLLPAAPDVAVNLLSSSPLSKTFFLYYWAGVIPFLIVAAAYGVERVAASRRVLCSIVGILVFSGGAFAIAAPMRNATLLADKRMDWSFGMDFTDVEKHVPADGLLMVDGGAGPHFAERRRFSPVDHGSFEKADVIVFRVSPFSFSPGWNMPDYRVAYGNLLTVMNSDKFGVTYWRYPWIVFQKGKLDQYDEESIRHQIVVAMKLFGS